MSTLNEPLSYNRGFYSVGHNERNLNSDGGGERFNDIAVTTLNFCDYFIPSSQDYLDRENQYRSNGTHVYG